MRFVGQGHEVTVELPVGTLGSDDADQLKTLYRKEYRRLYGREGPDVPLETITWRLEGAAPRPTIHLDGKEGTPGPLDQAQKGTREIYLPEEEDFRTVPVYDRYRLDPSVTLEGPAVVEEHESTVLLGPGCSAEVDQVRNLIVRWET